MNKNFFLILIVAVVMPYMLVIVAGCGIETTTSAQSEPPADILLEIQHLPSAQQPARTFTPTATPSATATVTPASGQIPGRVYLDKVIPPCTLVTDPDKDPCKVRPDIPNDIIDGGPVPLLMWRHYSEFLGKTLEGLGSRSPAGRSDIAHMAIRGTGIPDTARCASQVPMVSHRYFTDTRRHSEWPGHSTLCFVDVKVQEYVAGKGAPTVTLQVSHTPWNIKGATGFPRRYATFLGWDDLLTWEDFVKRQIEHRYAGSEHLFYIHPSIFTGAEVWEVRADFDIVRNEPPFDRYRSVSNECDTDLCAYQRKFAYIYEYPEIISETRKLHKELVKKHGGRITAEPGVADLVLDTYELTSFFTQVGAYENTTVTPAPPPVPGENDPYTPGTRVDDPPTVTPTPTPTATPTPTSGSS